MIRKNEKKEKKNAWFANDRFGDMIDESRVSQPKKIDPKKSSLRSVIKKITRTS